MGHRFFPMRVRAALAATLLALGAGAGTGAAQTSDPAAAELLARQADAWDKAIVRQDRAAIEGNMTEDFRQIDGDGDIEDKASFIDGLMSPKLRIDPYPARGQEGAMTAPFVAGDTSATHETHRPVPACYASPAMKTPLLLVCGLVLGLGG